MSLIALNFLHITSVLLFYIDVVLTLSILCYNVTVCSVDRALWGLRCHVYI